MSHFPVTNNTKQMQLSESYIIRYAVCPDDPCIIDKWFKNQKLITTESIQAQRRLYKVQFDLLMDTICNDLLPGHWRQTCLAHIYQPLHNYQKIALCPNSQAYLQQIYYSLSIVVKYFGPTIIATKTNS